MIDRNSELLRNYSFKSFGHRQEEREKKKERERERE